MDTMITTIMEKVMENTEALQCRLMVMIRDVLAGEITKLSIGIFYGNWIGAVIRIYLSESYYLHAYSGVLS